MANKKGGKSGPRIEPMLAGILAAGALKMPERPNNRGSKSAYPFAELTAPGMSFGVINKTPEQLASIISNQNRKNGPQKRDANGNPVFKLVDVMGADGKPTGQKMPDTNAPEYEQGPQFFVVAPEPNDPGLVGPDGKKLPAEKAIKARVWRAS